MARYDIRVTKPFVISSFRSGNSNPALPTSENNVDLVGTISCEMDQDKWAALIEDHDELNRVDQITVVNPFTQETEKVGKPGECVAITIGGTEVGAMRWCQLGSGVDVHGDATALKAFIATVYEACSGTFDQVG